MGLDGKVVVITGSTRGIGRAIAEECARQGATVVVSSRSAEKVAETVSAIRDAGGVCQRARGERGRTPRRSSRCATTRSPSTDASTCGSTTPASRNGYRPLDEESVEELARPHQHQRARTRLRRQGDRPVLPRARRLPHEHVRTRLEGRGHAVHDRLRRHARRRSRRSPARSPRRTSDIAEPLGERVRPRHGRHRLLRRHHARARVSRHRGQRAACARRVRHAASTRSRGGRPPLSRRRTGPRRPGRIYSLLTPGRIARGSAKMAWWGMTGEDEAGGDVSTWPRRPATSSSCATCARSTRWARSRCRHCTSPNSTSVRASSSRSWAPPARARPRC